MKKKLNCYDIILLTFKDVSLIIKTKHLNENNINKKITLSFIYKDNNDYTQVLFEFQKWLVSCNKQIL